MVLSSCQRFLYSIQFKIADHDYYVYDFALPMVTLYSLYSSKWSAPWSGWKNESMKQFTTLDTHDRIGVVDVRDILTDEGWHASNELPKVEQACKIFNSRIQQLGHLPNRFDPLFSKVFHKFVYLVLSWEEWFGTLENTKEGRNINRHYYSNEIAQVERPVVPFSISSLVSGTTHKLLTEGNIERCGNTRWSYHCHHAPNKDQTSTAVARINLADGAVAEK